MTDPLLCVCCQQVEPREGVVCDRDRQRLAQALWELRDLHALLPYALEPGRGARERRAPAGEAGLPLRADALDLAGKASTAAVTDTLLPRYRLVPSEERDWDLVVYAGQMRRQTALERVPVLDGDGRLAQIGAGDQGGAAAVASILDSWAQNWARRLDDEELPDPSVDALVAWLSRRLAWAFDNHPAIRDFAMEITVTLYVCRTVINVSRRPIFSPLACPGCKTAALRRQAGDKVWRCAECKTEVEVEHPDECECGCERMPA